MKSTSRSSSSSASASSAVRARWHCAGARGRRVVGVGRTRRQPRRGARALGIVDRRAPRRRLDARSARRRCGAGRGAGRAVAGAVRPRSRPPLARRPSSPTRQHQAGRDRRGARGVRRRVARASSPGHPIAGTEHTGAAAAFATLFRGRNVILTPGPETAPRRPSTASRRCGRRAARGDPADGRTATTRSSPRCRTCRTCSRSRWSRSWRRGRMPPSTSTMRPAVFATSRASPAGSPEMWRDIALANRDALLAEIDCYGDALRARAR